MSFPRYPAYVDSGDQSLGMLPTHWRVNRLKSLLVEPLKYGANEAAELDDPSSPRFVRITDVAEDGSLRDETFRSLPRDVAEPYLLQEGDVLLARSGATVGKSFMYQRHWGEACFAGYLIRARLRQQLCLPQWLNYFCHSGPYWDYVLGTQIQSTIQNVSAEKYANLALPIPPVKEQSQLVAFLDRETAKIDALVAEQEQLITLLKEKRQAVISHAVTKGLDPSVPMKDSGVKWLGDVPAHWQVCALRRLIKRIEQGWSPECEAQPADENSWGVLKAGCVNRGVFNPEENKTLPDSLDPLSEYEVQEGDILMSRASGSPELVGSTALVSQTRPRLMLSDKIFRIHLESGQDRGFFVWSMNAKHMREQIEQALSGGNGLANNLPQSVLLSFVCAVPPEAEQLAICRVLDEGSGQIDQLTAEAVLSIELLRERRSALISAAVTGQIDVRGLVATKEAA